MTPGHVSRGFLIKTDDFVSTLVSGQSIEVSRGAGEQVCDCICDWLWIRSPVDKMKYLLKFTFVLLHSGVEAKRGVEFRHSTRNASGIQQKMSNGVS